MRKRSFLILFVASFLCWLFPFIGRVYFFKIPVIDYGHPKIPILVKKGIVDEILHLISINDRWSVFILIFKNNIKGCIFNVFGGFLLGLGTLFNLMANGFYTADVFVSSYFAGVNIRTILHTTLPHSFELLGFWLSGTIGFSIAWAIIRFMKGKENLTKLFMKQMGICAIVVFF